MIAGAPALLVLFFYAYRYLSAARRMRRGGQPFVYEVWDGLWLMGKPATTRGLTILGALCIVAPIAIGAFAANALASLRSPCKSLLTLEDARAAAGPGLRLEHTYTSRFSCSTTFRGDADAEITVEVMSMPLYGEKGFRDDRERHGATVTETAFGVGGGRGLRALVGSKQAADEQELRANQDFERKLAAPRPPARGAAGRQSPVDSWLDGLPFRGAELWTLVPCDGGAPGADRRHGVSVSIRVQGEKIGDKAGEIIAALRDRAAPRLEAACRLSR